MFHCGRYGRIWVDEINAETLHKRVVHNWIISWRSLIILIILWTFPKYIILTAEPANIDPWREKGYSGCMRAPSQRVPVELPCSSLIKFPTAMNRDVYTKTAELNLKSRVLSDITDTPLSYHWRPWLSRKLIVSTEINWQVHPSTQHRVIDEYTFTFNTTHHELKWNYRSFN